MGRYGFSDVDWGFLREHSDSSRVTIKQQYPYNLRVRKQVSIYVPKTYPFYQALFSITLLIKIAISTPVVCSYPGDMQSSSHRKM